MKTILDQSHLTPFPLHLAPTYWSYDHTMRMYPLPTAMVICDTSGWGAFKVTYEGCCVINTGSMLRVEQGDGRGRYAGAWWEWDCGVREGREVIVGITEREDRLGGKEKMGRKKKVVDNVGRIEDVGMNDLAVVEQAIPDTQVEESQKESQMEDGEFEEDMLVDV